MTFILICMNVCVDIYIYMIYTRSYILIYTSYVSLYADMCIATMAVSMSLDCAKARLTDPLVDSALGALSTGFAGSLSTVPRLAFHSKISKISKAQSSGCRIYIYIYIYIHVHRCMQRCMCTNVQPKELHSSFDIQQIYSNSKRTSKFQLVPTTF